MRHYLETFLDTATGNWNRKALSDYNGEDFSYSDVMAQILGMHRAFRSYSIKKGDRVAICGRNSARWAISFFATATFKAVAVPILYDFTAEAVQHLLQHSQSSVVFTDFRTFSRLDTSALPDLKVAVSLENFTILWSRSEDPMIGPFFENASLAEASSYASSLKGDLSGMEELAVINYTSGTTGEPKGVMLPVRSISANVAYSIEHMPLPKDPHSLSMLPLAHMFGLSMELLYPLSGGSHVTFISRPPSPSVLMDVFRKVRPYVLVTVPLVMEKIVKGKVMPALENPRVKWMLRVPVLKNLVMRKAGARLMQALGGRVMAIPMGGAALNPEVERLLKLMGIPYVVGYGMTECGPLVAYEDPWNFRQGSCGKQLGGNLGLLRIDSQDPLREPGEIQVKGDIVTMGYFRNPEATASAFTLDGWFKTGDLGIMDKSGNLTIKGRIKLMILSSNGQNIYPEEIEARINNVDFVEESLVTEKQGRLVALVYPKYDVPVQRIKSFLGELNAQLPSFSRIHSIILRDQPFEHTPKQSIKRSLYQNMHETSVQSR